MAQQNSMSNKIKIPAYISEPIGGEDVNETYQEMIDGLIKIIDKYNNSAERIGNKLAGKTIQKQVSAIDYAIYSDGDKPVLLLFIKEKKQGYTDLRLEAGQSNTDINFMDSLASDKNCAVLYPNIDTKGGKTFNNWLTFVYVEPGKVDTDVISLVKTVLKRIFKLKIVHIKDKDANALIKKYLSVPHLSVEYVNITNNNNDSLGIGGVQISSSLKQIKKFEYQNVPSDDVEEFVNRHENFDFYSRKVVLSLDNNQELKYLHQRKDSACSIYSSVIEQIYNYETTCEVGDLSNLYDPDFILSKVKGAVLQLLGHGHID